MRFKLALQYGPIVYTLSIPAAVISIGLMLGPGEKPGHFGWMPLFILPGQSLDMWSNTSRKSSGAIPFAGQCLFPMGFYTLRRSCFLAAAGAPLETTVAWVCHPVRR